MPKLYIDFQDGFIGDTVLVNINGKQALKKDDLKTKFQIGLAYSHEFDIAEGIVDLETHIPTKRIDSSSSHKIKLNILDKIYIGISITADNQISYIIADQPFGYL